MAGRIRPAALVLTTAIISAALTSLVWLAIFNLYKPEPGAPPAPVTPAATTSQSAAAPPPSTAAPQSTSAVPALEDEAALAAKRLTVPVTGVAPADLVDSWAQSRDGGARAHEAIDIPAPRGTPVVAVEDGRIAKLFISDAGGLTIYQYDPSHRYAYYYAHLDTYASDLAEGQRVKRGQLLGTVGTTGNADPNTPHLHFAIMRLGPEKRWHEGQPVNPFRPLGGTHAAASRLSVAHR